MKAKRSDLITALDGRFDDHHAELAQLLLGQLDGLSRQTDTLSARIEELIAELPEAAGVVDDSGHGTGGAGVGINADADLGGCNRFRLDWAAAANDAPSVLERLDEIPGIGALNAQDILAEIGLGMSPFPTPEHLVSWAKLCPRTIQSGPTSRGGKTGKGNPYLKGALGEAAVAAAKTNTFLGERYRRIVKRRGKLKALVAVARSILRIIWQLLSDPTTRFFDLGPDYHANRVATERKVRSHIAQLTAMGFHVTLEPAA